MVREKESGQSILIIAAIVVVLLALVALVVDVGNAYAHRRIVQNAVDAGALAGARRLADRYVGDYVTEKQILGEIETFAEKNGLERKKVKAWFIDSEGEIVETVDWMAVPPPASAEGVKVAGDLPFTTYFAHLLGFSRMMASTTANAWVLAGPCSAFNLFPITFNTATFTETTGGPKIGVVYTLWQGKDPNAPGNLGWINWMSLYPPYERCPSGCGQTGSAQVLLENILDNTRSGSWAVGDWVSGSSGEIRDKDVWNAIYSYITADPWSPVIIPLYDQVQQGTGPGASGGKYYRISGFAAFKLRCAYRTKNDYVERDPDDCRPCVTGSSDLPCVRGEFERMVFPSAQDGCEDTGMYVPSFRKPR